MAPAATRRVGPARRARTRRHGAARALAGLAFCLLALAAASAPERAAAQTSEGGPPTLPDPGVDGLSGLLEGLLGGVLSGGEDDAEPPVSGQDALAQNFADLASEDDAVRAAAERRIEKVWSRSGSDSMDLLLERGQKAAAEENWDEALAHFGDLVMLAPDFATGWTGRAVAQYRRGELGAAITDFGEALAVDPMRYDAYAALGRMLEQIDRPEDALRAYEAALEIHPKFAPARDGADRLEPSVLGDDA